MKVKFIYTSDIIGIRHKRDSVIVSDILKYKIISYASVKEKFNFLPNLAAGVSLFFFHAFGI